MSRRRWYYTQGGAPIPEPIEALVGVATEALPRLQLMTDGHYAGLQATDGTPIDSRTKHREYMKARGLALADDFKGEWARAERERNDVHRGDAERTRDVAKALEIARHKRR